MNPSRSTKLLAHRASEVHGIPRRLPGDFFWTACGYIPLRSGWHKIRHGVSKPVATRFLMAVAHEKIIRFGTWPPFLKNERRCPAKMRSQQVEGDADTFRNRNAPPALRDRIRGCLILFLFTNGFQNGLALPAHVYEMLNENMFASCQDTLEPNHLLMKAMEP